MFNRKKYNYMKKFKRYLNLLFATMLFASTVQLFSQTPNYLHDPLQNFDLIETHSDDSVSDNFDGIIIAGDGSSEGPWDSDGYRLKRNTADMQYVVWKVNDITQFEAVFHSFHVNKDPGFVKFFVSQDNENYTEIKNVSVVKNGSPWSWGYFTISGDTTSNNFQYLKMTIEEEFRTFTPQLADMYINYKSTEFSAGTDNSWETADNWSNGIPDSSMAYAMINKGEEVIINGEAVSNNVQVDSGAVLTISASATLTVLNDLVLKTPEEGGQPGKLVNNGTLDVQGELIQPEDTTTILTAVKESNDHNALDTLITKAGLAEDLSGDGPFTLFAPTDAAFDNMNTDIKDSILADPTGALADVLRYHVIDSLLLSADLTNNTYLKTLQGDSVLVTKDPSGLYVNGAKISDNADIETGNGMVHVIDSVIRPTELDTTRVELPENIVKVVSERDDLSELESALTDAGLTDALTSVGPYTLFAPSNEAFDNMNTEIKDSILADPTGALADVLKYHVTGSYLLAADLTNNASLQTLQGNSVQVKKDETGIYINGAKISDNADLETENGVVHIIDSVIIPPKPEPKITPDSLYDPLVNYGLIDSHSDDSISDMSDGLKILKDNKYTWERDSFSLGRNNIDKQYVVWKVKDISKFDVLFNAFHRKDQNVVSFYVSQDGENYTEISDVNYLRNGGVWSWFPMIASASFPPDDYQFLKLEFEGEWGNNKSWTPSLSGIHINFMKDTTVFTANIDNNWNNEGNWSNGIPNYFSNVIISKGNEVTVNDTAICKNLQVSAGAAINLNTSGKLTVINDMVVKAADDENQAGEVIDDGTLTVYGESIVEKTILNIVNESENHTILETAIADAGLADALSAEGPLTLFAPSDSAFNNMNTNIKDSIMADPQGALAHVLKYHVIGSKLLKSSLSDSTYLQTLHGDSIMVIKDSTGIYINGARISVNADIETINGVVHVIDSVLLPSPAVQEVPENILSVVKASDDHSILETAIADAGLTEDLTGDGPFTLFAPSDEAFNNMDADVKDSIMSDPTGALADVLSYHIIGDSLFSSDLSDGIYLQTLQGDSVMIEQKGNDLLVNGAKITVNADIVAGNGIVHVIDSVLVPVHEVVNAISHNDLTGNALKIYPNPASEYVNLRYPAEYGESLSVQIYNVLGKKVQDKNLAISAEGNNHIQINVQNLKDGIYIVRFRAGNQIINKKLHVR